MQILKNRKLAITTVVILILAMSASTLFSPTATAHTPGWTIISYPYLIAAPNPVGVGQTVAVVMWVDSPLIGSAIGNDIRRHDYNLNITGPDGKTESFHWVNVSDTTSIQYFQYTPNQVGNCTLKFDYPAQNYTWGSATTGYANDTYLAASKTINLTVQEAPIPASIDSYPMPTEYWTRPVEGQNTYWYSIASNWLGTPYILGANPSYGPPGAYQPDGAAPNSAHIMWTKTMQFGGVVGGNDTGVPGEMYYSGLSYNARFNNPIIMQGILYYEEPQGNLGGIGGLMGGGTGDYVAVDLQTGKEIWRVNVTATGTALIPSFGYLYSYDTGNQHGDLPNGLLIAVSGSTWRGYDPRNGYLTTMNVTSVPTGTSIEGPNGELLKYILTNYGTATAPQYYLMEWNSSLVFGGGSSTTPANWYSGNIPGNCPTSPPPNSTYNNWSGSAWVNSTTRAAGGYAAVSTPAYDWNVSVTLTGTGWSIGTASLGAIPLVHLNGKILLLQGTFGGHPGDYMATTTIDPANITAIDISIGANGLPSGRNLWTQSYPQASGNNTRTLTAWDPITGIFVFEDKESMTHRAYKTSDGTLAWGPIATSPADFANDWNFLALGEDVIANGKLYFYGYSGELYCYNDKDGTLLWTYGNGGVGNSTFSGFTTPYGRYPIFVSTIADGKVYLTTTEHSPNSPLYKDAQLRCVNATDGTELWTIMDYGNQMYGGVAPIADGYLTTLNSYDSQIYCYGKGPSALTVTAPDLAAAFGQPVVIRGTVTDIAAGTQQVQAAARFPNGVPAVSDASMSQWMEYIYMQKPRPTDTVGVPIVINVVDANNNTRPVGTAVSDSNGVFSYTWTPDISGSYKVVASFAGSESYYPSHAETSFTVTEAAPTQAPYPVTTIPSNDMYFASSTIAIIIAIALATVVIIKKK